MGSFTDSRSGYRSFDGNYQQPDLLPGEERTLAIHVGLDLAQSVDYTALVTAQVGERLRQPSAWTPVRTEVFYRVQDIQRLPHGVGYGEQARMVVGYLATLYEQQKAGNVPPTHQILLLVDSTGVGRPVVDLLKELLDDEPRCRQRVQTYPLVFRQGEAYDRWRGVVGKTTLISTLQAILAADRLDLPAEHELTPVLTRELADYHIKIDASTGAESLGGVGSHDDLVTALALSVVDDPALSRVSLGPSLWS
jgi:hypothetical protein